MNDETILKLYKNFSNEIYSMTNEKLEISKKICEQEELLKPTLTEQQKQILATLNEYETQKNELVYKNNFIFGFKLATKLFVEGLEDIQNNNVTDQEIENVINEVIEQKTKSKPVHQVVNEFISQFEKDFKTDVVKESILAKAPILFELYNNYILTHHKPTTTYQRALDLGNKLQEQLEKDLTDQQKILLGEIDYCNTRMYEDLTQQLFVYGYIMHSQLDNECNNMKESKA